MIKPYTNTVRIVRPYLQLLPVPRLVWATIFWFYFNPRIYLIRARSLCAYL